MFFFFFLENSVYVLTKIREKRSAADQLIIGRAAVAAARMAEQGKAPSKYWVVEQADIIKFGRDDWKG